MNIEDTPMMKDIADALNQYLSTKLEPIIKEEITKAKIEVEERIREEAARAIIRMAKTFNMNTGRDMITIEVRFEDLRKALK